MLTPRGNYSAGATYNMLDFVLYGGASFVALENNLSGVTPSADSPSWQLLAAAAEEITVVSQEVEYAAQAAADYTGDPPESGWSSEIPPATNGNYLWTRIITTYSDGSSFTAYLVAKNGVNGSGAVSSVNGVSPDASGNVLLNIGSIATVDSTPTAGSTNLVTSGGVNQFVYGVITNKESISNKVSAWSETPNDNRYPSEKLVKDSLNSLSATKVDKAQGVANIGKVMTVGADGNLSPQTPTGGVTSVNGRTGAVTGVAEQSMISDAWSSSKTYAVGEFSIDSNVLYRCLVQHSNKRPPNSTYWKTCSVGECLKDFTIKKIDNIKIGTLTCDANKYGKVVSINFRDGNASGSAVSVIGTLPIELTPAQPVEFLNTVNNARMIINIQGQLQNITALSNIAIRGTVTYLCE